MTTATHSYCKKCSEVQPVLWTHFTSITIQGALSRQFEGMEAVCEVCGFEIGKFGQLSPVQDLRTLEAADA